MDLHSGYPFWLVKNGLLADYPALQQHLPDEEIVIIGSGISGALAAHELCTAGFRCTIIEKRLVSSGSTWASTAQLNYELDISLDELRGLYGEEFAVAVYRASFNSVHRVQQVGQAVGLADTLEAKSSLYLASDKSGEKDVKKEFELRRKHGFPAELFDREQIQDYRIPKYDCALYHEHAVQFDAYRLAAGIITHHVKEGRLNVYSRTCVKKMEPGKDEVNLLTEDDHRIRAKYVVCAPGYESAQFLPKRKMDLNSTYALVTQPLSKQDLWKDECLIWESMRPYFYLRTTADARIMMGGADESFANEKKRDALMEKKRDFLLKKCRKLFPHLRVEADFVWCGTFGETDDSLPYIGLYPGIERVFFALGYGGNGTSYSMMAAEIICNLLSGKEDERARLFAFERKKK